jgi:DNA-damage-inducible protein J
MKKIIIDILMFILMLIEFSKVYLPPQIHEIVGICLIALVIVHLILNRKYIKAIPKGKYNLKRSSFLIINVVFMIVFILTMIFGLLSSQEILTFLNIGSLTTVYHHKILAYLCLILLGIHLGMNMNGTINMFLTQMVREKRVPLNLSLNADDNARSDLRISKKERENGIDGVDARELLKEMKKIVADAKTKESSYDDKAVI